jgi:hypothetical protein
MRRRHVAHLSHSQRPNPQLPLADDGEGARQIKQLRSVEEKRVMATPTPNTSVYATELLPDVGPVDPTPQPPSDANDAPPITTGNDALEVDETR